MYKRQSIRHDGQGPPRPHPGVILVFAGGKPAFQVFSAGTRPLVLGREGDIALEDARLSRRHAEVRRDGGRWSLHDLGSRNGSARDGQAAGAEFAPFEVLRLGDSVLLASDDVGPLRSAAFEHSGDVVVGPRLRAVFAAVASAARGDRLHLTGETGTGKELAAPVWTRTPPRSAPSEPSNLRIRAPGSGLPLLLAAWPTAPAAAWAGSSR